MFFFPLECPAAAPPPGSVRAIRGLEWPVVAVRVELDWTRLVTQHTTKVAAGL